MNPTFQLSPEAEKGLTGFFFEFFGACLDAGLTVPFFVTVVAVNESVLVFRADGGNDDELTFEPWAEHTFPPGLAVPIMIGAIDPRSGAALLGRIERGGPSIVKH